MSNKKARKLQLLVDRYYGKKDLLDTFLERDVDDPDYIRDLKRRLRGHHNDLIYRGNLDADPQ